MENAYLEELELMKKRLLIAMEDYMTGDRVDNALDVSYSTADISECSRILAAYVGRLDQLGNDAGKDDIMECVREVVLQLNELFAERPDLIDDSEHDAFCDYVEFAARGAGLKDFEGDLTEEWRKW